MKKVEFTIEVDRAVTIRRVDDATWAGCTGCRNNEEAASCGKTNEYLVSQAGFSKSPAARSNVSTLNGETLGGLLAYLDPDPELAGQKYELIRRKLVKFFECRGCACPEDYADITIDLVAVKISNGLVIQSGSISYFFYGVARNVLRDYRRQLKKQPLSLDSVNQPACSSGDSPGLPEGLSEQELIEQQLKYLDLCLRELPEESRELILQYYMGQEGSNIKGRKLLAERLAIPLNALRIRAHRVRAKLRRRMCELLCKD